MNRRASLILGLTGAMLAYSNYYADLPEVRSIRPRRYKKTPLSKKQIKSRAKAKRAKQQRKLNRI